MNNTKFQTEFEAALDRIRKIKEDRDRLLTAARDCLPCLLHYVNTPGPDPEKLYNSLRKAVEMAQKGDS